MAESNGILSSSQVSESALSNNAETRRWLLEGLLEDPSDLTKTVPVAMAIDCIRLGLSKRFTDSERIRKDQEKRSQYNYLLKNRLAQAELIRTLGLEQARIKPQNATYSGEDKCRSVMYRFELMISRIFEYFQMKGMRLEPFQLELLRGVVLGVTHKQFGDSLYKYNHVLLEKLGLSPLGSENYNYMTPCMSHLYVVNLTFSRYSNSYTLCLAPRQCGKSLMMGLLLAAVLLHLDINVMVHYSTH